MESSVTLQQLLLFHSIDCQVYARLVIELECDPNQAKKVVAFWYWLEKEAYKNLIKKLLTLPPIDLYFLFMDALICLDFLNEENPPERDCTSAMCCLVDQDFSLGIVIMKRQNAIAFMERFLKNVADKVLVDTVPKNLACQHNNVPENDRSLFITFSKGHPISKAELRDLITRNFGDCVEAIHMRNHQEPLFARVVLRTALAMAEILGEEQLVKLSINGKDVRVRRFVSKKKKD